MEISSLNKSQIEPENDLQNDNNICQICYTNNSKIINMPCCNMNLSSTLKYCQSCIQLICIQSYNNIGKCPTCRSVIRYKKKKKFNITSSIHSDCYDENFHENNDENNDNNNDNDDEIEVLTNIGICYLCNTNQTIIKNNYCEACLYGSIYSLRYECSNCHYHQRISHPMWRYQENSHSFGNITWVCHNKCNNHTYWRILPEDIPIIPFHDIPESWEMKNQMKTALRQFLLTECEVKSCDDDNFNQPSSLTSSQSRTCVVM